jgi:hypothetical protein
MRATGDTESDTKTGRMKNFYRQAAVSAEGEH